MWKQVILSILCAGVLMAVPAEAAERPVTNRAALLELSEIFRERLESRRPQLYYDLLASDDSALRRLNENPDIQLMYISQHGYPVYYTVFNRNAARTISTDDVWPGGSGGFSLDGAGTAFGQLGIWDGGGVRTTHQEFGGRVRQEDAIAPALSDHSTHVAGTMVASGFNPAAQGMSFAARLHAYDWDDDEAEVAAEAADGMNVSNHSYGFASGWAWDGVNWWWFGWPWISQTEDWRFGFYMDAAQAWDQIAFDAPFYTIVKSAGNDRNDNGPAAGGLHLVWDNISASWVWSTVVRNPDGGANGYDCIPPKGIAKNVITVGAVNDLAGGYTGPGGVNMSNFSGWGPTDDGRIKPDLVANGVGVFSCDATANNGYTSMDGTSMATPNLSGSINLLVRHYETTHGGATPLSSTVKAILIQTADESGPNPGPDYEFGWGLANTLAAAQVIEDDGLGSEFILEGSLANGETDEYYIVSNGIDPLRLTLAWIDPPETPPAAAVDPANLMLVNDLDLRLEEVATAAVTRPYVLNPGNPAAAATTGDNFRDNVEQVFLAAPSAGTYRVTVTHKGGLAAPQTYSLVTSDALSGNYVLLIDNSGSMSYWAGVGPQYKWQVANDLAKADAANIFNGDPNAQVMVMSFTGTTTPDAVNSVSEIKVLQNFTSSQALVDAAIDGIYRASGWTPLAEALCEAAEELVTASLPYVPHLIVYTDGDENSSDHDQSWSVCGVCWSDLSAPPDVQPADWLDGCDPDDVAANPCTPYQVCLADQLSANSIVNVRYFGEEISKSGPVAGRDSDGETQALFASGSKTPDGDVADGGNKAAAPDFRFLQALAQMSGGWISVEQTGPSSSLKIESTHNTIQGLHETIDVTFGIGDVEMGGFDFLIAYDASALALQAAVPGPPFYDPAPDGCGWEYFTYRFGPFGNCGDVCPSGMVRVFGLAETNNGPNHPSCFMPDMLPATLFTMDFMVSNDRTLECQHVPVRFFWTDCGDNSVSSVDGEILYVSDHVYEFEGTEITDSTFGFPTYFGVPPECLNPDPDKPAAISFLNFMNGGINIVCADSIDGRGDLNLNGVPCEIADAVLYSEYFVHGISVFNINLQGQIAASDCNVDGITLSVADLVTLIGIVVNGWPCPPGGIGSGPTPVKVAPAVAEMFLEDGVLSVDAEIAAAFVKTDGKVEPTLLADNMEMQYLYDADARATRILVFSWEGDQTFGGEFLGGIAGDIMAVELSTPEGVLVKAGLIPDRYALYPCYPNPFNPITTISFALTASVDYELVIYNALGQTVKTFSGHGGPGLERINWNASGFASGVYFYRLTAGDFTDTKKMVLLK